MLNSKKIKELRVKKILTVYRIKEGYIREGLSPSLGGFGGGFLLSYRKGEKQESADF